MQVSEITQFFGLPLESTEFDLYLSERGILQRPQFTSSPVERINWKNGGLSLVFLTDYSFERSYGESREPGQFIFTSLQAYGADNDSGFSPYQGKLPFNLTFETTLAEARQVFGEPTVDHTSGPNHVYVWYDHQGFSVALCFLPNDKGLSFFDLEKNKKKPPIKIDW